MRAQRCLLRGISFVLPVVALACNGDDLSGPAFGSLDITASTSGPAPDPNGYTAQVDAAQPQRLSNVPYSPMLSAGNHTVLLGDVASNCTVAGENPRVVSVRSGAQDRVTFEVICSATTGALEITTVTTGESLDVNGYSVSVDGRDYRPIATNGSTTVPDVAPGTHIVGLANLAPNCTAAGGGSLTVTVSAGASVPVRFDLTCSGPPPPLSFYQISTGMDPRHTCAVTTTNRAYCWGTGYLGDGPVSSDKRLTPVEVAGGLEFRAISAGYSHTCAVTTDDRAFCWGENYGGQLGDGTETRRPTPVPVATSLRFRQVTAGDMTNCGLSTEKRVYCWGSSWGGMMGTGTSTFSWNNPPMEIAGGRTYRQVSTGMNHSCALTDSYEIFCWGGNGSGQLGDGSTANRLSPVRVSGTRRFIQVSAGFYHTCAVTTANQAFCWGRDGGIGDGTSLDRWEPTQVAGGVLFDRVTAGGAHSCGETTDNRAYCWGYNGSGALGDGTQTLRTTPVPVAGGLWFAQVSGGNSASCGVTSEHRGYCWGNNLDGAIGDGTTTDRWEPVPVAATAE
jgi:alpha-tubulin suppressor-like RCC1 family protein